MQHGLKQQKHANVTWVDVESPTPEALAELEKTYALHPVHVQEAIQKVQHNQVEREKNYLFFVLHIPTFDGRANKILVHQMAIFLGKDFLITIRSNPYRVATDLFERSQQQPSLAEANFGRGASYLLYTIIGAILEDISHMADHVIVQLDEIEDLVFDNNASDAQQIGQVRQKIVKIRRVVGPKRIILKDLDEQIDDFSGQSMSKYFSNNTKTVNKLWEVIEEAKETVEIFKDADFTTSTEQTNEILAVLTLLFTFTIPITVVGTLYGMNVPLPGGIEAGAWTFLGPYTTFGILLALSVGAAVAMYLYFKGKKWF